MFADLNNNSSNLDKYAVFTISDSRPTAFADGIAQAEVTSFNLAVFEKGHKNLVSKANVIYEKLILNAICVKSYFVEYDKETDYTGIYYSCSV